jgi:hypothetical protein
MPTPSGSTASTLTLRSKRMATASSSTFDKSARVDRRPQAIEVFYAHGFRTE